MKNQIIEHQILKKYVSLWSFYFCSSNGWSKINSIRTWSSLNEELLSEITPLLSLKFEHDIKNRPGNSKFAKRFHESYNLIDDLNVTILQNNIEIVAALRYHEMKHHFLFRVSIPKLFSSFRVGSKSASKFVLTLYFCDLIVFKENR